MNLVIDITTSRIVFYSMNSEQLIPSEQTIIVQYDGIMPTEMNTKNCWDWKLIGKELVNTGESPHNKKMLMTHINQTCEAELKKLPNALNVALRKELYDNESSFFLETISRATGKTIEAIKQEKKNQHETRMDGLRIIEFIRSRFQTALKFCNGKYEIDNLRKDFLQVKFTKEYVDSSERFLIETVQKNLNVNEMYDEVMLQYNNFDIHTKRQKTIDVQADTRSVFLIKGIIPPEAPSDFLLWDSHELEKTELYENYPKINKWINDFAENNNLEIARVAIVELKKDGKVKPHIDCGEYYRYRDRYHLCLSGSYAYSVLNLTKIINKGELMKFNNKLTHWSEQLGEEPRISIIFDASPKTNL